MVPVIGGFCRGKTEYLESLPEYTNIIEDAPPLRFAGDRTDSSELVEMCLVTSGFRHYIRRLVNKKQVRALIDYMIVNNPDAIVIMDKMGGGIVPMDPVDKEYRGMMGRADQRLAGGTEQVYRVICGIGARIR